MSLVVVCCSILLSLTCGALVAEAGDLAAGRTRAQTAADAAALAAIATSLPGVAGSPAELARTYARANDGVLHECNCRPGATSMDVEVEVAGALARARAVLDTRLLAPLAVSAGSDLQPAMRAAVDRLLHAARGAVRVVSAGRSAEEQASLWARALRRHGTVERARRWVAPPGSSMHERGLAVDLAGDLDLAERLARELGLPLHRPLDHEPWHFELIGYRG